MATNNQDGQALYKMSQILQGDKEAMRKIECMISLETFEFWGTNSYAWALEN